MALSQKKRVICLVFGLAALMVSACSPSYTWGYARAIHPDATQAYIYAVMARENWDYEAALEYYDAALRKTDSDRVRQERREVAEYLKNARN